MSEHNRLILASREAQSIVDGWTEYLCLQREAGGQIRLFFGGYEFLGESNIYYDENIDDVVLPAEIDGQKVFGLEGDAVVGGDLSWTDDAHTLVFQDGDAPEVQAWLDAHGWTDYLDEASLIDVIRTRLR